MPKFFTAAIAAIMFVFLSLSAIPANANHGHKQGAKVVKMQQNVHPNRGEKRYRKKIRRSRPHNGYLGERRRYREARSRGYYGNRERRGYREARRGGYYGNRERGFQQREEYRRVEKRSRPIVQVQKKTTQQPVYGGSVACLARKGFFEGKHFLQTSVSTASYGILQRNRSLIDARGLLDEWYFARDACGFDAL